jgi:hypothetical protein
VRNDWWNIVIKYSTSKLIFHREMNDRGRK